MVSHSNFHTLWLSVELPNFPFYFDFTVCRNVVILWQMSINLWLLYKPLLLLGLYMYFDLPVMDQTWQKTCKVMTQHSRSLIVCLGFFFSLKKVSLIWRRNHYGWRASNFDLCWALTAIEQWGFLSVPHLLCTGHPFILDQWHLHLLQSVWQWSCHYLFLRLRSVAAGIRTPNLLLAQRTL